MFLFKGNCRNRFYFLNIKMIIIFFIYTIVKFDIKVNPKAQYKLKLTIAPYL